MSGPVPTGIKLHSGSSVLELDYAGGGACRLEAEFLRVHSPSAEVRGHGRGQEVLQTGKRKVRLTAVEPVGNYAVKLTFDDGHDSGIYSWEYLHELCSRKDELWREYLDRLREARASRDPKELNKGQSGVQVLKFRPPE